MWLFSSLMFFLLISMGIISGLTPYFSRQSTPFGVAISGKQSKIESYKKTFLKWNVGVSFLLGLPIFIFPLVDNHEAAEMLASIYITVSIILFLISYYSLFMYFRKKTEVWKSTQTDTSPDNSKRVVMDLNYHKNLKVKSQFTFFISQLIIIVIPVIVAMVFYDSIPENIPINWDSQFEINHTVPKSIWTVLALPGIQLLMIPVLNFSHYSIIKSKQHLSPIDPEQSSENSRLFRKVWSNTLFAITIATQLLISGMFLYSLFSNGEHMWIIAIIIVIFTAVAIGLPLYVSIKYGQAGEKLLGDNGQYYDDPDQENNWKYGLVYFNKDDPSVFVEKRFGIGSTLNFARWQTWFIVAAIAVFTLLIIFWSLLLT